MAMNEGMRFLAHQLAWEITLDKMRQRAEDERLRSAPVELPAPKIEVHAMTAGETVGGDHFEAA